MILIGRHREAAAGRLRWRFGADTKGRVAAMAAALAAGLAVGLAGAPASGVVVPEGFAVETFGPAFTNPTAMAIAPDGRVFVGKRRATRADQAVNPGDVVRIAPPAADVTRHYTRFTDVVDDTIDARVYLGIHFRTADVQAARIGKDVAHWLDHHYFAPVR